MFGWEFSPLVAGGLGVVCKDITASLSNAHGAQVTYVLPRVPHNIAFAEGGLGEKVSIADADVDDPSLIKFILESSFSNPYFAGLGAQSNIFANTNMGINSKKEIYGVNLMQEVYVYAEKAAALAEHRQFDIIHSHDWMTAPAAMLAKERTGKPMVMHVHATEVERALNNPNPRIFAVEQQGFVAADKIIAVSELTKQKIVENYGIDPNKIVVVHNAVERVEKKFGPIAKTIEKDDKVVLFLARLTAFKGANYLLSAAPKVLKALPNTKFLFVGGGELLEKLIEQSVDLGISNKVTFTGFLPHEEVDRAYRLADVFVMPSVSEPFGITSLEAIRNGTPVILSKTSGASEVLQNVLKVDFWDIDEMANKLIAVLRYGVLADELANNSKRDLERLTWDKQTEKIMDVYQQLRGKLDYK